MVESGGNQNSDGIARERTSTRWLLTLPAWKAWTPGTDVEVAMTYYLPAAGVPSGMRLIAGSQTIGLKSDFPALAEAVLGAAVAVVTAAAVAPVVPARTHQPGGLQCLSDLAARGSRQWQRPHDQRQGGVAGQLVDQQRAQGGRWAAGKLVQAATSSESERATAAGSWLQDRCRLCMSGPQLDNDPIRSPGSGFL